MLTTAAVDGPTTASDLLEAHPLVGGFVEGGHEPPLVAGIASAAGAVASDAGRSFGPIRPRGATRLPRRPRQELATPAVTWNCAVDANTENQIVEDCMAEWDVEGGDEGELKAPPVAIGPAGTVVTFDVTEDARRRTSWLIHKKDENGRPAATSTRGQRRWRSSSPPRWCCGRARPRRTTISR
jgi:hypothetical protein